MRNFLRHILDFFNLPKVLNYLIKYRELIRIYTWRDFKSRYRGSFGGILWSILQPLIMMVIYTLVFSTFLQIKFGGSDSPFTFSVYLLCGLLPWANFSDSLSTSTTVIRGNVNLVKRVVFPLEVLPINLTLVGLIQQVIGFVLLIPLAVAVSGQLYWTAAFLPVIMLLQLLLFTGISWIWSSLSVFLPDMRQFTPQLVSVLMFLTPIFYPEDIVPAWARIIFKINPIAHLVSLYRNALMDGKLPPVGNITLVGLVCLLIFLAGFYWFSHTKKGFPDVL